MQRGIVTIQRVIANLQRVVVIVHRGVALLQRGIVNIQHSVVCGQRGVVAAHRPVAGVHQGRACLLCPEQRGRREKYSSQCVIFLDIQHKATAQRAKNEIHQTNVSKKRSRDTLHRTLRLRSRCLRCTCPAIVAGLFHNNFNS